MHPSIGGGSISLPVVAVGAGDETASHGSRIRPSRSGKRRAIVLAIVQAIIAGHIILWLLSKRYGWFGGETLTPVEPSESMEFTKHGIVNAGLIFFTLALLSTLVLGRWFCGWGCHIVMLQDLCGWFMKKCGVRPKPFRSRLLIYVPLLLALYMFIWPLAYRWGVLPAQEWLATKWPDAVSAPQPVAPWGFHVELTTPDFWKTFAGVAVAIPFLAICGFATVYFLGAKGFCTYGCPYGGFFAPLDKYAVGKIRVTDACEGCGHCTAVCTSNVRVHEEVREYGMVVDPGCMKCLDCVSVCPNEALYFGFGKPSVMKGEAKNKTPERKYDMSLGEEFAFAGIFALTFFSTRGVYGVVPMLMAAGIAGCVTFIAWKTWRLLRDDNAAFHRFQLKLRGSIKPAGLIFAGATAFALLLTLHSGAVKASAYIAGRQDDRVTVSSEAVFARNASAVSDEMRVDARSALNWYQRASSIGSGGIGLLPTTQATIDIRRAWLHCVLNEFDQAEAILREAQARDQTESTAAALAMLLRNNGDERKSQEALELYERLLPEHPEFTFMLGEYESWALPQGRLEPVKSVHRGRLERDPFNRISLRAMSILLLQNGKYDEGLAMTRRWIDADPRSAEAHRWRALALADLNQMPQAIAEIEAAVRLAPHDANLRNLLADMLDSVGRSQDAARVRAP